MCAEEPARNLRGLGIRILLGEGLPWLEEKAHLAWKGLMRLETKRQDAGGKAGGMRVSLFVLGNE